MVHLSLTNSGMKEIEAVAGEKLTRRGAFLDKRDFIALLQRVYDKEGAEAALNLSQKMMEKGFEAARQIGASMSAFAGSSLTIPEPPEGDDIDAWRAYPDEVAGMYYSFRDFDNDDFGPLWLMAEGGARGSFNQLRQYIAPAGVVQTVTGGLLPIKHGFREGQTPEEALTRTVGARWGLANALTEMAEIQRDLQAQSAPGGYHVLARARRSQNPGVVFARAALKGERDPLTDEYSRLFVGLPVEV
jgi:hypothetical protein